MSAIYGSGDRPSEDLTARARIRDAALAQFAEHGVKGATIRGIAAAAGTSSGLVRHHFGSKDGLRRACDEAVLDLFRRRLVSASVAGEVTPSLLAAVYEEGTPLLRYVARTFADGTPAAAEVIDEMVAGNREFLTATWPERFPPGSRKARDAAAVLSAMSGGTVLLHEQVARLMGLRPWTDIRSPRIGAATFEVFTAMAEYLTSAAGKALGDAVAAVPEPPTVPAGAPEND